MRHDEHATPGYRRAGSWRALALAITTCVVLTLLAVLVGQLRGALDPQARADAQSARRRQSLIDSQLAPLDTLVAAGWRISCGFY